MTSSKAGEDLGKAASRLEHEVHLGWLMNQKEGTCTVNEGRRAREKIRRGKARQDPEKDRGTEQSLCGFHCELFFGARALAVSAADFLLCTAELANKTPSGTTLNLSQSQVILLSRSCRVYQAGGNLTPHFNATLQLIILRRKRKD